MIAKLKKILPQNAFARGVSVLVGGTAGAQALMVFASPLLTRLYTPEDFGLLAVYSGLLALFAVVASLRYELAIPLPETNTEAANVLVLSLLVVLLMTSISGVMVLIAGEHIAAALNAPKLTNYFWLLPIGIFLSGIYKVFNYWAVRTKSFGEIARTRISQTLATLAVQLFGFKLGSIALLFGQAGGQGVGSLRLARSAIKHKEFSSWTWSGVQQAAKRYKQFPIFSTWSGLFNTAGAQLPPLMFAAFFSAGAAGLYALANRILKLPITVIGGAISKVYFSDLVEARTNGQLPQKIEQGAAGLIKLSFPAGFMFMLFAPDLFLLVFGTEWKVAGDVARWMVPSILLQFISSPLSVVYFVLEKEKIGLIFQIGMLVARALSLIYGYYYLDFIDTTIVFSFVSAACYFFYSVSVFCMSGAGLHFLIFELFLEFLKGLLMLAMII
uniref:lipopolysaccharide biosynthesis protein n=1 Tax=Salinivibrio sp. HTSP TaxID=2115977 RepID=UPI0012D7EF7B